MVAKRTGLNDHEKREVFESLAVGLSACVKVCTKAKISSAEYQNAADAISAIHRLADELGGNLRTPLHSTPPSRKD